MSIAERGVIVTCAVTGAGDTVAKNPHVPVTPAQIAAACIEAARAGAAVAHVHVRDPLTGGASRDPALYREVVQRVADGGVDVILNLTTGLGGDFYPGDPDPMSPDPRSDFAGPLERLVHVEELRPEICSLDCGTMNFADGVFVNSPQHLRVMSRRIQSLGVKPELEVFDLGHARFANRLIAEGLVNPPPLFQVCLGVPWGAAADTRSMLAMIEQLPADASWSGFGIGKMQMPMVAQAYLLGGNVRVGLEDNLFLEYGKPATNAQLVRRAVEIITSLGGKVASAPVARALLGLAAHDASRSAE
jgi:uncharacterized protein (DUF849 family)